MPADAIALNSRWRIHRVATFYLGVGGRHVPGGSLAGGVEVQLAALIIRPECDAANDGVVRCDHVSSKGGLATAGIGWHD